MKYMIDWWQLCLKFPKPDQRLSGERGTDPYTTVLRVPRCRRKKYMNRRPVPQGGDENENDATYVANKSLTGGLNWLNTSFHCSHVHWKHNNSRYIFLVLWKRESVHCKNYSTSKHHKWGYASCNHLWCFNLQWGFETPQYKCGVSKLHALVIWNTTLLHRSAVIWTTNSGVSNHHFWWYEPPILVVQISRRRFETPLMAVQISWLGGSKCHLVFWIIKCWLESPIMVFRNTTTGGLNLHNGRSKHHLVFRNTTTGGSNRL